jgi:hypothetical protein
MTSWGRAEEIGHFEKCVFKCNYIIKKFKENFISLIFNIYIYIWNVPTCEYTNGVPGMMGDKPLDTRTGLWTSVFFFFFFFFWVILI